MRRCTPWIALALIAGCSGGSAPPGAGQDTAISAAQPTWLPAASLEAHPEVPPLQPGEAHRLEWSGEALGVLQVAPWGDEVAPLSVSVIFDRPMVPLARLDAPGTAVPVSCSPALAGARWAGTSTAVLVPDGAFPPATSYRCSVPAGTVSLDGSVLAEELDWTFRTRRPAPEHLNLHNEYASWNPADSFALRFNQPVSPQAVLPHLSLVAGESGAAVPLSLRPQELAEGEERDPRLVVFGAELERDTAYDLALAPGVRGVVGDLPSTEGLERSFRTYGPLAVAEAEPRGRTESPEIWLELGFTTPVSGQQVASHLRLSPGPTEPVSDGGDHVRERFVRGLCLEPRTTYTATITAGLKDTYGQALARDHSWTFTTGDWPPQLEVETGWTILPATADPPSLPWLARNLSALSVRVAPLDPQDLLRAGGNAHEVVKQAVAAVPSQAQPLTGAHNAWGGGGVELAAVLQGGRGLAAVELVSPDLTSWFWKEKVSKPTRHRALVQVTDLGLTLKVSPERGDVWVTSLSEGSPLADVSVQLYRGAELLDEGTTGPDGLFTSGPLVPPDWAPWRDGQELWVVARKGDDLAVLNHSWDEGVAAWPLGVYAARPRVEPRLRTDGFADRGVYRPGDKAHAQFLFRRVGAEALELPADVDASWTLSDPMGNEVNQGTTRVEGGEARVDVTLPADGAVGRYHLRIDAEGWDASSSVSLQVLEYRAPAFRVELSADPDHVGTGQLQATAEARYLFGAPLGEGTGRWAVWREPGWFHPDGWDGYEFGPLTHWWMDEPDDSDHEVVVQDMEWAAHGVAKLDYSLTEAPQRTWRYIVEAEVTDVDRQVVANRATITAHPANLYVGLKPQHALPEAGQPCPVDVAAVDLQGQGVTGRPVDISVVRRSWNRVREKQMDGRWSWVSAEVDEPVTEARVESGAAWDFTPPEAGYYVLTATVHDHDGNTSVTSAGLYAVGDGTPSWALSDERRLELVPDKRSYAPGDTARLLVKTPRPGLNALVTVERSGVMERRVQTLEGTAGVVEIPLGDAHMPNVFVSVLAVEGAAPADGPDAGRPAVWLGLIELDVDAGERHLDVAVGTDRSTYGPGDSVTARVSVTGGGQPVPGASVLLYAVDHAVLSLTGYETPDPHEIFYRSQELVVETADNRGLVLDRSSYLLKAGPVGGGGGEGEGEGDLRTEFVTTPLWAPGLVTDAQGQVELSFDLPDNLTTFRVMAVVTEGAERFGGGERELQVSRPLLARPALPRFLREGDDARAGVVVHNHADRDLVVQVTARGDGIREGAAQEVSVAAGEAREVAFELRGLEPGEARLRFAVTSGELRDAVEVTLPVQRLRQLEVVASAGDTTDTAQELVQAPTGVFPDAGGLRVDLASTALVGATDGLDYLWDYPHGCVEQVSSQTLATLLALEVGPAMGLDAEPNALQARVRDGVQKILDMQRPNGGLSYWPGGGRSSLRGSAYALQVLARAEGLGYEVDGEALDRLADYLRATLKRRRDLEHLPEVEQGALLTRVAEALAVAGRGDAGLNNVIYRGRDHLWLESQAALARAIALTSGPDARTAELARLLQSRIDLQASSAQVQPEDRASYRRLWMSADTDAAVTLRALLTLDSSHVLAPRLARHLVRSRRQGRWHDTRATVLALDALAYYVRAFESGGGPASGSLKLDADVLFDGVIPPGEVVTVDRPAGSSGTLALEAREGRLYYASRLSYAPTELEARDEGFTLLRRYEIVEGGPDLAPGALVRVSLRVVTPVDRYDVAVVDPLPAGLEPVNDKLATTSRAPGRGQGADEGAGWWSRWVFDRVEQRDDSVRLFAAHMPAGVHTWRYLARATTPGRFDYPAATVEEMYAPEVFGRTDSGELVIGPKESAVTR